MGDIDNFVYDYYEARISQLSQLLFLPFLLKIDYKYVNVFFNVSKNGKNLL